MSRISKDTAKIARFVLVAQSCPECGGDKALQVFIEVPTADDKTALSRKLGGMWCISIELFVIGADGECTSTEE